MQEARRQGEEVRVTRRRAAGGTDRAVARSERDWMEDRETVRMAIVSGCGGM